MTGSVNKQGLADDQREIAISDDERNELALSK
jgi:hypothetical protein